jgi:hypothetical protein
MSQAQEKQPLHPPLDGPRASHEAGSDERQKANVVEQGLRDMAESAQAVRDVMISAQPSEESSREQALIEYEERIAAIQALTQGVSDLQALMNMSGHGPALLTFDSHTFSRDEEKQTKHEKVIGITSEIIEPKEEEDDILPGLKLGGEQVENPKPRQPPLPTPQPSTPPAGVPLHLIPLVPPRSSPSNRRRTSTDPSFVATKNDEDAIGHFPAGSPSISRTLAYAMGCTQPVGSSHLPVPGGVGVDSEDEKETKGDANDTEKAHRPPVVTARSEISEDQVDNAAQQHTDGEARHESGGITEERLPWETKSPHKVTFLDMEAGDVAGEIKTIEKDISKNQEQGGAEFDQPEVSGDLARDETGGLIFTRQVRMPAQPHLERRYIGLMEQEMEIRREKQEIQILEETLQAREKDLCTRLETVRQRLQAIRQRKALMDSQEDSIRQKLADASTSGEQPEVVETVEPRLAAMQGTQRAGVKLEADAV